MTTSHKFIVAAVMIVGLSGPAYPQNRDILQLQNDVLKLQNQIKQLQDTVDQRDATLQSLVEKIYDQVNGMSAGLQKVTQTVEGTTTRNEKAVADLSTLLNAMNGHINDLAETVNAVRSQLSGVSQQITAMKSTSEALPGPEDAWRAAMLDFTVGNYDLAINEFRDYASKYSEDPRAGEAQYYVGECLYNQKKFDQAIIEYDSFLQKYPQNDKTKTALYKKGSALVELNDPKATAVLQQVVKQYPNTIEATNASQKIKELATGARGKKPARNRG